LPRCAPAASSRVSVKNGGFGGGGGRSSGNTKALLEGAEYGAETEDAAEASEAEAAERNSQKFTVYSGQKINWRRRNERKQDGIGA